MAMSLYAVSSLKKNKNVVVVDQSKFCNLFYLSKQEKYPGGTDVFESNGEVYHIGDFVYIEPRYVSLSLFWILIKLLFFILNVFCLLFPIFKITGFV